MSKIKYIHINFYGSHLRQLIERNQEFCVTKTTYSRKIKTKNSTLIFNEDGGGDFEILSLINHVRRNAKEYLGKTSLEKRHESINFFDLYRAPKDGEVIWKVDIKSAYWIAALKRGIILEETNNKLLKAFDGKPAKELKRARLKALGSLATKKTIKYYTPGENGKSVFDKEEIQTEVTKDIYMDICRDVDGLMRECVSENYDVVYYYWDCIFVPRNTAPEVINFFKKRDYDVSVEETKLTYIEMPGSGKGFLISECDDKAYMVKKESRHLLDGI